jgi:hypothetical protein
VVKNVPGRITFGKIVPIAVFPRPVKEHSIQQVVLAFLLSNGRILLRHYPMVVPRRFRPARLDSSRRQFDRIGVSDQNRLA